MVYFVIVHWRIAFDGLHTIVSYFSFIKKLKQMIEVFMKLVFSISVMI